MAAFEGAGVDLVFMPAVEEMYPPGFATNVRVAGVSEGLDGAFRPGHFEGVATVVCKLLLQCLPDAAYFGEKDYQQLLVVRRMARDLDIPVHIEGVPTVREADGLALSSRNVYLSAEERRTAPLLNRVLRDVAAEIAARPDDVAASLERGRTALDAGGFAVDYLELRDAADLAPVDRLTAPSRLLVAARLGRTRLIDNIAVVPENHAPFRNLTVRRPRRYFRDVRCCAECAGDGRLSGTARSGFRHRSGPRSARR